MSAQHDTAAAIREAEVIVARHEATKTWSDFIRLSGVEATTARRLVAVAKRDGSNPAEWRVGFEAIPRAAWRRIEAWYRGAWVLDYIICSES